MLTREEAKEQLNSLRGMQHAALRAKQDLECFIDSIYDSIDEELEAREKNTARIKTDQAKPFILKKHYAKRMPSISYAFGLFTDKGMIGVCTFGSPASPPLSVGVCGEKYKNNVIELNRVAINEKSPKNSASFMIGSCLRMLGNHVVVSYADRGMSHNGYIYQATNWIYTGASKERTDIFAGEGKHPRHHKGDLNKRVHRSSKHRYIFFTGSKTFKRNAKKALKYQMEPYPKGESKKYECIDIPTKTTLMDFT